MSNEPSRRRFLSASAAAALTFGLLKPGAAHAGGTIRPFRVRVPERELAELRRRVQQTRWPDAETVTDLSQGAPQRTLQQLARYWAHEYDWRTTEAKLNALPQFMSRSTDFDGRPSRSKASRHQGRATNVQSSLRRGSRQRTHRVDDRADVAAHRARRVEPQPVTVALVPAQRGPRPGSRPLPRSRRRRR